MILIGKVKKDFENYVLNKELNHDSEALISVYNQETLFINYNNVKETLLNALIIEWFDSVGIYIEVIKEDFGFAFNLHKGDWKKPIDSIGHWENRNKAIIEAIKKANEIYNLK